MCCILEVICPTLLINRYLSKYLISDAFTYLVISKYWVKSTCKVNEQSRKTKKTQRADNWASGETGSEEGQEGCTTSLYLQDDTFIVLVSMPKSFDTVQDTVRLAVGTTLILCVILPLTKGLSSSWAGGDNKTQQIQLHASITAAASPSSDVRGVFRTTRGGSWIDEWLCPA